MNEDQLVQEYLPLVKSVAGKYSKYSIPFEDLVQEGLIGLIEAARAFDPQHGTKLSTYAYYHIRKRIIYAVARSGQDLELTEPENIVDEQQASPEDSSADETQTLVLPADMPPLEARILRLSFEQRLSLKAIAEKLDLRAEKVRYLKAKALRRLKIRMGS
jgi:RNA polymerase sigma factor (sigma-70 family)